MIPFDSHIHSRFSFDGCTDSTVRAICEAAIEKGLTHIALTDHFEANNMPEGLDMPYDADAAYEAMLSARESFGKELELSIGIEAGQIHQYPTEADRFFAHHRYETVIGSVHNIRGLPDFYFWDMKNMSENEFFGHWTAYLREICELLSLGCIDILAHLTYPIRYLVKAGKSCDLSADRSLIERILGEVIDRGIYLEVNSSGFRQGLSAPLPDARILSLYREMGGQKLSIGSDAHCTHDIGADFESVEEYLLPLGFEKVSFIKNKQVVEYRLDGKSTLKG